MERLPPDIRKALSHPQVLYWVIGFAVILFVVDLVANYKIVKKTGNFGLLSLLFYVPCLNVLLWLALAFGDWPKRDAS